MNLNSHFLLCLYTNILFTNNISDGPPLMALKDDINFLSKISFDLLKQKAARGFLYS